MGIRTPDEAIRWLREQELSGTYAWDGDCKMLARTAYGIPSDGTPSALLAWEKTDHRGTGDAPRGAFVWWRNKPHGHVGVADGKGNVIANVDWAPAFGRVRTMPIKQVSATLGLQPAGWSRDIDGVLAVPAPPKPSGPPALPVLAINLDAKPSAVGRYVGPVALAMRLCGVSSNLSGARRIQRHLGQPPTGRLGRMELAWLAQRFDLETK